MLHYYVTLLCKRVYEVHYILMTFNRVNRGGFYLILDQDMKFNYEGVL